MKEKTTKSVEPDSVAQKKEDIQVRVKIDKLFDDESKNLKALASVYLDDFAIHGFKVLNGENGLFLCMPSTAYTDKNGVVRYDDIFHPTSKEVRDSLSTKVLEAYHTHLALSETEMGKDCFDCIP